VINSYDPQPYSTWTPGSGVLISTGNCTEGSGGIAYQENYSGADGRLFVAELDVDSTGSNTHLPVIHVFQIASGGNPGAISIPGNLSISSGSLSVH